MKAIIPSACVIFLAGTAAHAQEQPPPPPPQQQQPTPPPPPPQQQQQTPPPGMDQQQQFQVSDSDVRKFAEIYVEVEEKRNELTGEMNAAESQEDAQEVQARMQEKIVETIADHGWSVARYNQIATAISNDQELRTQALELISELSSS